MKTKPIYKTRNGRFQISLWKQEKVIRNESFQTDRIIETFRVCIQYSQKNRSTGEWNNQQIWCQADDLRSLFSVMDLFNEGNPELNLEEEQLLQTTLQ